MNVMAHSVNVSLFDTL